MCAVLTRAHTELRTLEGSEEAEKITECQHHPWLLSVAIERCATGSGLGTTSTSTCVLSEVLPH
jgi:hypothetical protein